MIRLKPIKALGAIAGASLFALLAACSSFGPVQQPISDPAPVRQPSDDPEEDAIGAREHPRIVASYGGIYTDRPAEIMLARIVGRLLAAANQPNTNFTVTILDTAEVNAFALPGGYVYVTRGLLALASDTSEIAAVLAHEIAHVTLKHARARTNKQRESEIVDKVVSGVFGSNVDTDQTANRNKMQLAAFSQAQELAADKEGIMTAGKAGYDPHAAARFLGAMGRFAHFSQGDVDQADDFLSSHPSTPDRIQKAIETARALGDTDGALGSGRQDAGIVDHEGALFKPPAEAVEDSDVPDCRNHGASLIGMVTMTPPMMSFSL